MPTDLRELVRDAGRVDVGTPDGDELWARARRRRRLRLSGVTVGAVVLVASAALVAWQVVPSRPPEILDPAPPAEATEGWRSIATAPVAGRAGHVAVWTGAEMVVWGGYGANGRIDDGAAYDPATDTWRTLPRGPLPALINAVAVWSGREVVILGSPFAEKAILLPPVGAAYDPSLDRWRQLPDPPWLGPSVAAAVWTGSEVLAVTGGTNEGEEPLLVGAYDPSSDAWRASSPAPVASGIGSVDAVWTGQQLLVFLQPRDGRTTVGVAYQPTADAWELLPESPIAAGWQLDAVWTGTEALLLSAQPGPVGEEVDPRAAALPTSGAYRPSDVPGQRGTWRTVAPAIGIGAYLAPPVWTGDEVLVLGTPDGLAHDPATDSWRRLRDLGLERREFASAVWTGSEAILWGGAAPVDSVVPLTFDDGAAYRPPPTDVAVDGEPTVFERLLQRYPVTETDDGYPVLATAPPDQGIPALHPPAGPLTPSITAAEAESLALAHTSSQYSLVRSFLADYEKLEPGTATELTETTERRLVWVSLFGPTSFTEGRLGATPGTFVGLTLVVIDAATAEVVTTMTVGEPVVGPPAQDGSPCPHDDADRRPPPHIPTTFAVSSGDEHLAGNEWTIEVSPSEPATLTIEVTIPDGYTVTSLEFDFARADGPYPGSEVRTISVRSIDLPMAPGIHVFRIGWDGTDDHGKPVALGTYQLFGAMDVDGEGCDEGGFSRRDASTASGLGYLEVVLST